MRDRVRNRLQNFYQNTVLGRFILKNRFYLISFLIPFLVLIITYMVLGVYPFGERETQIIDSFHQYVPFFSEFRRKLLSGSSLFYSFTGGMGMNFWAIFAYYLASPLNLILLLLPQEYLLEGFTFILTVKISLSSFTFSYYISKHSGRYDFSIVYFALFYALCGWVLGYYWNIMWLDCLYIFPLVILGLERLMKEGKGFLYGLMLAWCIASNYYIAIMVCIFLVLYFFVLFFEQEKRSFRLFVQRGFKFAGYSILAAGLCAVLLLPTLSALSVSNSADSTFPTEIEFYNSFAELVSRHFAFSVPTDLSGSPNLYFGVLTLMLVILYAFKKEVPLRVRVMKLLLLGFLLLSTNFKILDYIWHGFHFPNSLPARFTFIYAFLALTLAFEALSDLRKYRFWQYAVSFLVSMGLVLYCWLDEELDVENYVFIITEILIFVYFVWMCLYKSNRRIRSYLSFALLIVVTVEAGGNAIYGFTEDGTIDRTGYNQYLSSAKELKAETQELEDGNFYRMELDTFNGRNNNMWLNFPGISLFASTMGSQINELMGDVGYFSATNKYSYEGATPLTDSIFGVKYLVSTDLEESIRTFEYLDESGDQYLYVNPYALSLGFMVDDTYAYWDHSSENPADVLNDYVQKTIGTTEELFTDEAVYGMVGENCEVVDQGDGEYTYSKESAGDDASLKITLQLEEGKTYYIYYEAAYCDRLWVNVDGSMDSYVDTRGHIVELGEGTEATLEFVTDEEHSSGTVKLYLFSYNEEVFEEFYQTVSTSQWEIEDYSETYIKGTITVSEDGIMYTSIPYDSGWTVLVDGEKVEVESIDGSLLYIHLTEGEHTIEMRYIPTGFVPGFYISALSCLIFVVIYFRNKKIVAHHPKTAATIHEQTMN